MTTEELIDLIEAEGAWHRRADHDPREHERWGSPCAVTIGGLSHRSGMQRRHIEEAIQTARLQGVPVITDGGIRVAQNAAEATALASWLAGRMATQRATLNAIEAVAGEWARREALEAVEARALALAGMEQLTWVHA